MQFRDSLLPGNAGPCPAQTVKMPLFSPGSPPQPCTLRDRSAGIGYLFALSWIFHSPFSLIRSSTPFSTELSP